MLRLQTSESMVPLQTSATTQPRLSGQGRKNTTSVRLLGAVARRELQSTSEPLQKVKSVVSSIGAAMGWGDQHHHVQQIGLPRLLWQMAPVAALGHPFRVEESQLTVSYCGRSPDLGTMSCSTVLYVGVFASRFLGGLLGADRSHSHHGDVPTRCHLAALARCWLQRAEWLVVSCEHFDDVQATQRSDQCRCHAIQASGETSVT